MPVIPASVWMRQKSQLLLGSAWASAGGYFDFGDRFEAGVKVTNESGQKGRVKVKLQAVNAVVMGSAVRAVTAGDPNRRARRLVRETRLAAHDPSKPPDPDVRPRPRNPEPLFLCSTSPSEGSSRRCSGSR